MSDNLFEQLKQMRNEPAAGYVNEERRSEARERLMSAIASEEEKGWVPTAMAEFAWVSFSDFLTKPAAALASFAILILGSLTTVSAASQSLPGDTLYGVKLVSERTQLSLASADRRAVLHTEFAGRRLQEITTLTSETEFNEEDIASAVSAFKREVESATTEIQNLPEDATDKMIAQISEVTERFEAIQEAASEKDSAQEDITREVLATTEGAAEKVVDAVVESHEAAPKPASDQELKEIFDARYKKLIEQRALSIGRIEVIREHPEYRNAGISRDINEVQSQITELREQISDASVFALAGGYRAAFAEMRNAEALFTEIVTRLTEFENILIELSQPEEPAQEAVEEELSETALELEDESSNTEQETPSDN